MIHFISPICTTPQEHLACDEALLDLAEQTDHPGFLRFFEAPMYFVVLGYGKKMAEDINVEACKTESIPVLRRCSGGGTVVQGPGCFNFSLILPADSEPGLETITGANRLIMGRHRKVFRDILGEEVHIEGVSDLTLRSRKFSGNAQRRRKRCLLFHGAVLLRFDLDVITRLLRNPEQQPEYRGHRSHADFLTNIPVKRELLQEWLVAAWRAQTVAPPSELAPMVKTLASDKYSDPIWNERF